MLRFVTLFVGLFLSFTVFAATPYSPEVNARFKKLENPNLALPAAQLGNMRVARVVFNSDTMGTSSSTAYSLGVTLPANALLWDGVVYVTSTFTGTGSVALECEDSKNILADQTIATGWTTGSKKAITPVGTAAAAVSSIGAACSISARVTNANVVGKFDAWIEYFVTD